MSSIQPLLLYVLILYVLYILYVHTAFAFFADPRMQSFYKRFIRDYMRYKDYIQCFGHELVQAVRQDALQADPGGGGVYYALHIRRGDFQFKVRYLLHFTSLHFTLLQGRVV